MKKLVVILIALSALFLFACAQSAGAQKPAPAPSTAHVHNFSDWVVLKQPTCTEEGTRQRSCTCGEVQTIAVPLAEHTQGEWITDIEPDCTETGTNHLVCAVCGKTLKHGELPAKGHTMGSWITDKEPTCKEEGQMERVCSVCSFKETVSVPPAHTPGEWIVDKQPTCKEKGEKHQVCAKCGAFMQTDEIPLEKHTDLINEIKNFNMESDYAKMYECYKKIVDHYKRSDCAIVSDSYYKNLLESMLYGKWTDSKGNYLDYTYIYENYSNTEGDTWYGTNIPNSKKDGQYYYYTDFDKELLVIGYQDAATEEKKDNFRISFSENSLTLKNLINSKTYTLNRVKDYEKVVKGSAKLAYDYLAKKILDFKSPKTVKVTQCMVDNEKKYVYAVIEGENTYGGNTKTLYRLYEKNGSIRMEEITYQSVSTNIDVDELNQKLKTYLSQFYK